MTQPMRDVLVVRTDGLATWNCLVRWYSPEKRHSEVKVHDMTSDTEVERELQTVTESADESDDAHVRSSEDSFVGGVVVCLRRRVQTTYLQP